MIRSRTTLCLTLLACMTSVALVAQVSSGSMSGVVSDPNGASVPGAKVSATNSASGGQSETVTSDAGLFVFPSLSVGTYEVTVEKPGFKKLNRSHIEIRIASRQELDLKLDVGDVQQTVTVSERGELLETSSSQRGTSLSPQMMNNLPFFSGGIRNPRAFVSYMPGVNTTNTTGEITVSGAGARSQELLIDGASNTNPESGGTSFNFPSAEIFGEFKLLTSSFDAEYGRMGGGIEVYVTKSGTNDYHGSAFLNMRRDIWNANSWAFNAAGRARPKTCARRRASERPPSERFLLGERRGVSPPVMIKKTSEGRRGSVYYLTWGAEGSRHRLLGQHLVDPGTAIREVVPDLDPPGAGQADSGAGTAFPATHDKPFARTTQHRPAAKQRAKQLSRLRLGSENGCKRRVTRLQAP